MKMRSRFHGSEIDYWAHRYTERQRERPHERTGTDLKPEVLRRGYLTKDELYELARRGYNLSRLRDGNETPLVRLSRLDNKAYFSGQPRPIYDLLSATLLRAGTHFSTMRDFMKIGKT